MGNSAWIGVPLSFLHVQISKESHQLRTKLLQGINIPVGCIQKASVHVYRSVFPYFRVLKSYISSAPLLAKFVQGRRVSSISHASGSSGLVIRLFVHEVFRGRAPFFMTNMSGPFEPMMSLKRPKVVFRFPSRGQTKARFTLFPRRWGFMFKFWRSWSRQRPW
jgi:hypothetical protein